MADPSVSPQQLQRQVGVFGAAMMGLGSIIGTGVFVSIGIAAGIAGPAVIIAIIIGAVVATFNGLNSAQLAANHPVSGGTYEYGYKYLTPWLGFTAGWTFLLAKSASAATAALGFSGYLLDLLNVENDFLVPLALAAVIALTAIVLGGIRRSNRVNIAIVSATLFALTFFVIAGLYRMTGIEQNNFQPFFSSDEPSSSLQAILYASALMFVAYTGYGRIATLGEEVTQPRRTIPRAIIAALITTMVLYIAVAVVSVGTIGTEVLSDSTLARATPLETAARTFETPGVAIVIALGAISAMIGVLLNLILGLSRVLLAMGRRGDMPAIVTRINDTGTTPYAAVIVMGICISILVLTGNVKTTWSFSAFTVLIYYVITNLAAMRLKRDDRLFPHWLSWAGLLSCLFLAFWVEVTIWVLGIILIAAGLAWHFAIRRLRTSI